MCADMSMYTCLHMNRIECLYCTVYFAYNETQTIHKIKTIHSANLMGWAKVVIVIVYIYVYILHIILIWCSIYQMKFITLIHNVWFKKRNCSLLMQFFDAEHIEGHVFTYTLVKKTMPSYDMLHASVFQRI